MHVVESIDLDNKLVALKKRVALSDSLIVAYSGGVDSALLASVAHQVLGNKSLAVIAKSPSITDRELKEAISVADRSGFLCQVIETDEIERPEYKANKPNRCYFCKDTLYQRLLELATNLNYKTVANGTNLDDLDDYRPGLKAATEHGIISPLAEVGLTKTEIRALSKRMKLPTWDKPAQACLASRVPYGTSISTGILKRIGAAEELLKDIGFNQLRVRDHNSIARIEVPLADLDKLLSPKIKEKITIGLKSLGYKYVTVDLEGFRSGSMNPSTDHNSEVFIKNGRK